MFREDDSAELESWRNHARDARCVGNRIARLPVIEVDGSIAATAIGTLKLGLPTRTALRGAPFG